MKGVKLTLYLTSYLLFLPAVVFGQGFQPDDIILRLVLALSPILSGALLLYFVYGFVMYVRWYHDKDRQGQGRLMMTWAVIGIFIFATLWGVANWIDERFYSQDNVGVVEVVDSSN